MSKSTNRHPEETFLLRDARRLWHVAGPTNPPFGCDGCHQRGLCGGLQIETRIYSCLTFCRCKDPATCDNVCPRNMRHLVARSQEVGGFDLSTIPTAPALEAPPLPSLVPLIYHRHSRVERLRIGAVALPLAEMMTRTNSTLRFATRAAMLEHFRLHEDCQIILSGTDADPTIERWWRVGDREAVIRGFRELGVVAVTSPNYSLFADVPRYDNFYNMKRIAIAWREFQREGLPVALHVNARTERDWERWAAFVAGRPEVNMIAFEFGTGAGSRGRIGWHVNQLRLLAQRVGRPLTLMLRGGGGHLTSLASAYAKVIYIDTALFVKTINRQRGSFDANGGGLTWQEFPMPRGEPVDALMRDNIGAAAAFVQWQLDAANGGVNAAGQVAA